MPKLPPPKRDEQQENDVGNTSKSKGFARSEREQELHQQTIQNDIKIHSKSMNKYTKVMFAK